MRDIVVTWPKARSLEDYLGELETAVNLKLVINYRVGRLPVRQPTRCYVVHSGFVRGWNMVLGMGTRDDVIDVKSGDNWPHGLYIVRSPRWHPCGEPLHAMGGFQGWRYFNREDAHGTERG